MNDNEEGASFEDNIILLTIDCLRYDQCGFNGYSKDTTLFLDELASDGYVFDRAITPGTWTSESFPGILAGRHSPDVSYYDELRFKAIPEGAETLATQMRGAGFGTVATVSNTQLTSHRNFDCGFDSFSNLDGIEKSSDETEDPGSTDSRIVSRLKDFAKETLTTNKVMYELNCRDNLRTWYSLPALANQLSGHWTGWPYTRADDVLSRFSEDLPAGTEHPVFGWTHLMDLHAPLHPDGIDAGGLCDRPRYRCHIADVNRIANNEDPVYKEMYDSVLRFVDDQIRSFVDALKARGEWANTTLIVTSDHGEAMGDRGEYGHWSHYPYDDLIRVPLIVHPAGGIEETHIEHVFSLSWLYELVAELAEIEAADLPAQSGVESHLDGSPKDTIAVTDSLRDWGQLVVASRDDWKLVRNYNPRPPRDQSERYSMLKHIPGIDGDILDRLDALNGAYRLSNDPGETSPLDVSAAPPELQEIADDMETPSQSVPEVGDEMAEETRSKLKDLGYL
ncbi:sulfatase-like hydrolase/transferase [Saliphagus infecundisoli]|uniref:Sulfatase-like hydrolase/transferase n=1 Tax=Saliphagus infecundisoli TaxID=1849069 RepID=A0ABD5QJ01_9EURY|nr:sulfatase-like hydrolase/transferase [Saliphagus infecundisoli]